MSIVPQPSVGNRLLLSLTAEDFAWLAPHLRRIDMPFRSTLHAAGEPIAAALFPDTGYASMLASLDDGDMAEVGMIGNEGMVGLPLLFGTDRSTVEAMVQAAGTAQRLPAEILQRAVDERPGIRSLLLRYAMAFNVQVTMTAVCNGRHKVVQRLARWIMMAHDRTEGDEFAMTHEFLSMMLAVRRAGITVAAGSLQRAGYISAQQGRIRVVNRAGLETAACECHQLVRREYARLLGSPHTA